MTHSIGYRMPGDLGGPMDINEGYRWNVPVVTYGFDQEFVDYFGERGIEEVEKAVAILNGLPPASQIDLANSPFEAWKQNQTAAALNLVDLKLATLAMLLEQFGLTDSIRFAWNIKERTVTNQQTNYVVVERNFDPETLLANASINGEVYNYTIFDGVGMQPNSFADAVEESAVFPGNVRTYPIATAEGQSGSIYQPGLFCDSLSRDDVGGIRYLLSKENRKVEPLLPGVSATPGQTNPVVNVALRPGVEKILLVRMPLDGGRFLPMTNIYNDVFITNGLAQTQEVQRVVIQPDILFRARDFGLKFFFYPNYPPIFLTDYFARSDASKWQNNAGMNENPSGAGPGLITPGAEITFGKTARYDGLGSGQSYQMHWASFGEGPEDIFVYAGNETASSATVSTGVSVSGGEPVFTWKLLIEVGVNYRVEASANLKDWTPVGNVSSADDGFVTFSYPISDDFRYFRAILDPQ